MNTEKTTDGRRLVAGALLALGASVVIYVALLAVADPPAGSAHVKQGTTTAATTGPTTQPPRHDHPKKHRHPWWRGFHQRGEAHGHGGACRNVANVAANVSQRQHVVAGNHNHQTAGRDAINRQSVVVTQNANVSPRIAQHCRRAHR